MTFRSLAVLAFIAMFVAGCPKKEAPVVQEAGPPPAAEPTAPQITELSPLDEEDGSPGDAAADAGRKKWSGRGGGSNANQLKIKTCCNAIRSQAKALGAASPEAFQLNALAAQCDVFATQMGAQGSAPELNQLRQILQTAKVPVACQL